MNLSLSLLLLSALLSSAVSLPMGGEVAEGMVRAVGAPYSYNTTRADTPRSLPFVNEKMTVCDTGKMQSPINFPGAVGASALADGPQLKFGRARFSMGAPGPDLQLACLGERSCGHTLFRGKKWGKQFPLESHTVHQSADGKLVVLATVFDYPAGSEKASTMSKVGKNSYLAQVLKVAKQKKNRFMIDPMAIVDTSKGFVAYTGSLTTPPCTEGVTFLVQRNVESVSKRQVRDVIRAAGMPPTGNSRPVQSLNGREIICHL